MWAWIQRFFSTGKPQKSSAIENAFLAQSRALADVMKRQQDTIDKLGATLDRIVTAKYDKPFAAPVEKQPNEPMPDGFIHDQAELPLAAALTVESDEDFIKAVSVQ